MAYEARTFQSATTNTPPSGTDPMVDNTASGDVQAIKLINPTASSVAPWIDQAARNQSLPVALSTEDVALLTTLLTSSTFTTAVGVAGTSISQPTGGTGLLGFLSGIYKTLLDRLPTLSGGNVPVTGSVAVTGSVEVANDSGNPLPVSGTVTANLGTLGGAATEVTLGTLLPAGAPITGQALETGGTSALGWLSSIRKAITDMAASVLKVAGNVASGATDAGNPVKVGGRYNATPPTLTDGQRGDLQLDASGRLIIASTNSDPALGTNQTALNTAFGTKGDTAATDDTGSWSLLALTKRLLGKFAVATGLADATALPTTTIVGAGNLLYNGATLDLQRGNVEGTILASAARTATATSADTTNQNARGVVVIFDVTSIGTGSLTVRIQGKDSASGKYFSYLVATAVTATGTYTYTVYPGASAAITASGAIQSILTRTWRVSVTPADGSSWTYSVGYALII